MFGSETISLFFKDAVNKWGQTARGSRKATFRQIEMYFGHFDHFGAGFAGLLACGWE
jgi:hypothetical protein